jgi:hypothetical protein
MTTTMSQTREHLEWEAFQMVSNLGPEDLTTLELAALIGVLHAAHARRVITAPTGDRPLLRIVPKALERTT